MLRYLVLIVTGVAVSIFLLYYVSLSEDLTNISWSYWISAALIGSVAMVAIEFISIGLDRLMPWQYGSGNRMLTGIVVISLFILLPLLVVSHFISTEPEAIEVSSPDGDKQLFIKVIILTVIFSLIYSIIYFARVSYSQFAGKQVETIRQERKQIDLQLRALKSQLSPHFLFNSLNSVSSLVHSDHENAELFVRKLALMYQYILDSFDKKLVSLKEEMAFARAYHHLLAIRFGDNIQLKHLLSDQQLSTMIPPVTIQLLLENAVKHNIIGEGQTLHIEIRSESGYLIVENNITAVDHNAKSHKVGIGNIKARYKLLTGKQVLIQHGESFRVKLPLIR
ncbi:MAG: sensor histidine kinase [Cyclobacteriaceae bacterium]